MVQFYSNRAAAPSTVLVEFQNGILAIKGMEVRSISWQMSEIVISRLHGANKWTIENAALPEQSLLVEDQEFITLLINKNEVLKRKYGNVLGSEIDKTRKLILWVVLVLVLGVLFFWKGTPLIADFTATQVPQEWENDLGNELIESVLSNEKVDSEKTRLLREFYRLLGPLPSDDGLPQKNIELTVIEKDQFNAFAIPGRKIVVFSGVFDKMNRYEELMALLGHEAGHVEGRHAIRTLFRSMSLYAVFSVFFGDLSGFSALLIQNAHTLQNLSYSRDFERDADFQSHQFLCKNNSDPNGTIWLMESMKRGEERSNAEAMNFFSTHPMTGERIDNAREAIKESPCNKHSENQELKRIFESLKSNSF